MQFYRVVLTGENPFELITICSAADYSNLSHAMMTRILYFLSVILLTSWLVGVLVYDASAFIHLLLITAVFLIMILSQLENKVSKRITR